MTRAATFKIGDRVALRADFLRSIGDYSYQSASLRGVVERHPDETLVGVRWDGDSRAQLINRANLILADKIHLEPA